MSKVNAPAPNPCVSCPYRRDVPSGVWSEWEYAKLELYDRLIALQPVAIFQCHQTERGTPSARVCGGWIAAHGAVNLLAVRIGVSIGELESRIFDYETSVPVFSSGHTAAKHGRADIDNPSPEAMELIRDMIRKRPDIEIG